MSTGLVASFNFWCAYFYLRVCCVEPPAELCYVSSRYISYISSFSWYSTTTRFFTLYTYNIYGQHHIASSLVVNEFQGASFCQRIPGCLVLFEGWVVLDTIIVTSLFNSTICIIWRRALSICTTFFLISIFAPWRNPSIVLLYKSIHFLKG